MERARVPVNVVTGALGAGKTTVVLEFLARRPSRERWAVLVNEFGSVGVDGAVLSSGTSGVEIREIAGGCVCCAAGPMLRAGLVRLLREVRPDRLLVEPSGLAHPAGVLDHLRSEGLREAVDVRATLGLVDPRRLARAGAEELDRLQSADVWVGTHADQLGEEEVSAFLDRAARAWPPPLKVVTAVFGRVDPALFDLSPSPRSGLRWPHPERPAEERGWLWPPDQRFRSDSLVAVAQRLLRPPEPGLLPALRVKGLFHTERGWQLLQGTPDRVCLSPSAWRRDNRVEVLAGGPADWAQVDALWETTRILGHARGGGSDPDRV